MINKFVKGKTYVFIDVANTFYAQRTLGWKMSYEKLLKYFKKECGEDVKCFAYAAYNESRQGERKFLDMLEINGYIVRTKALKTIPIRGGTDKHKGSTAILMSGDSDFAPPLDRIKKKDKQIIVMSAKGHIARELIRMGKYINLRKLKDEIARQ